MARKLALWSFAVAVPLSAFVAGYDALQGREDGVWRAGISLGVIGVSAAFLTWRERRVDSTGTRTNDPANEQGSSSGRFPEAVPAGRALLFVFLTIALAVCIPVAWAVLGGLL